MVHFEKGNCVCSSCGIKFEGYYNVMAQTDSNNNHYADCDDCKSRKSNTRKRRRD